MVVVGAGVIGLAIGWRAAQRGLRTLVLDAGSGQRRDAASRPGCSPRSTEADFGEQELTRAEPGRPRAGGRRSPSELESRAGVDVGYRADRHADRGASTATRPRRWSACTSSSASSGSRRSGCPPASAARWSPGSRRASRAGSWRRGDHQVSPARAGGARWSRRCERPAGRCAPAGASRRSSTRARAVVLESGEQIVRADAVVIAAGARVGRSWALPEEARVPVRPVKGQILRLRARRRAQRRGRGSCARPRSTPSRAPTARLVVGATVEERGFDTRRHGGRSAGAAARAPTTCCRGSPSSSWWRPPPACGRRRRTTARSWGRARLAGLVWATGPLAQRRAARAADRGRGRERCSPARSRRASCEPFSPARFAARRGRVSAMRIVRERRAAPGRPTGSRSRELVRGARPAGGARRRGGGRRRGRAAQRVGA